MFIDVYSIVNKSTAVCRAGFTPSATLELATNAVMFNP